MDNIEHLIPARVSFGDPYSAYRKIRNKHKILRVSPTKWLIMGYDEARMALNHPGLSHWDDLKGGDEGTSLKKSVARVAKLFSPDTDTTFRDIIIQELAFKNFAYSETDLKEFAWNILASFKDQLCFDFIKDFASPYTFNVICKIIGLSEEETKTFYKLTVEQESHYLRYISYGKKDSHGISNKEIVDFVQKLAKKRCSRTGLREDLMSKLIQASINASTDHKMDCDYVASIILFLIYTGHHNMTNFLGNIIAYLCKNPVLKNELRFDLNQVNQSINEFLRLEAPVHFLVLKAVEDTSFQGKFIKCGSEIIVCLASANRDESFFADPDAFRLKRENATHHLSFGYVAYRCVGAKLANLEIGSALKVMLERFPEFDLQRDGLVWKTENIVERGLRKLIVKAKR